MFHVRYAVFDLQDDRMKVQMRIKLSNLEYTKYNLQNSIQHQQCKSLKNVSSIDLISQLIIPIFFPKNTIGELSKRTVAEIPLKVQHVSKIRSLINIFFIEISKDSKKQYHRIREVSFTRAQKCKFDSSLGDHIPNVGAMSSRMILLDSQ